MILKDSKCLLLPTEKDSKLYLVGGKLFSYIAPQNDGIGGCKNQHIHILSNELNDFLEGDFIYDYAHGRIVKFDKLEVDGGSCSDHCKKIIATTDTDLLLCQCGNLNHKMSCKMEWPLPGLSKEFIEDFVNKYNDGILLKDILVEYKEEKPSKNFGNWMGNFLGEKMPVTINLNKENCIIIKLK